MAKLEDIKEKTGRVDIDGTEVDTRALSGSDLAEIFARFPEVGKIMQGRGAELDPKTLIAFLPQAIPAVIAYGTDTEADGPARSADEQAKAERRAGRLSVEAQVDLLASILKLTFKSGMGPFGEKLRALTQGATTEGETSAKNSPKR